MSYSRFTGDCEVYVYAVEDHRFCCCFCALVKDENIDDRVFFDTKEEMNEHLQKHLQAGHKVPDYVFKNIEEGIS